MGTVQGSSTQGANSSSLTGGMSNAQARQGGKRVAPQGGGGKQGGVRTGVRTMDKPPPGAPGGGPKPGGGGGKPGGGDPFTSGTDKFQQGGGFWDDPGRPVAGLNEFQRAAGGLAGQLPGAGQGQLSQAEQYLQRLGGGSPYTGAAYQQSQRFGEGRMPGVTGEATDLSRSLTDIGSRQVTGAGLADDPAIKAANQAFSQARMPLIQNQAALAGLGNSTAMTNAAAAAQAQTLLPMIQGGLAREERGIDRQLGATGQAAGNLFGAGRDIMGQNQLGVQTGLQAGGQQQAGQQAAAAGMAGLGGQQQNQLLNSINAISGLGGQYRGAEQEGLDAPYQAQQGKWKEALNAMYGPLGFLGNMGGATSTQSKK